MICNTEGIVDEFKQFLPVLSGVPPISSPKDSEILVFPASRACKTVGEIKTAFGARTWARYRHNSIQSGQLRRSPSGI